MKQIIFQRTIGLKINYLTDNSSKFCHNQIFLNKLVKKHTIDYEKSSKPFF